MEGSQCDVCLSHPGAIKIWPKAFHSVIVRELGIPALPLPSWSCSGLKCQWHSLTDMFSGSGLKTTSTFLAGYPALAKGTGCSRVASWLPTSPAICRHGSPPAWRWCASFTRAEMPRGGRRKCPASTSVHWHLLWMPFLHLLNEGKSSHTRGGPRSVQRPSDSWHGSFTHALKPKSSIKSWTVTEELAHENPGNISAENTHMGFSVESAINPGVNPLI